MPTAACRHQPPGRYSSKTNSVLRLHTAVLQKKLCFSVLGANRRSTAAWRAAASHRLRCLMWETQFGKRREAEREKGGTAQKSITFGSTAHSPGFFRVPISFLGRPTPVDLLRFSIKAYFLKIVTILLAKQSLRTSKMAARNTSSSSDALLDRSPAHPACDWPDAAAPALLFVKA